MAAYSDALANPMDAAKMKAAADMLRRRETMATIGQLSGDPILGRFGEGERKRISGRRKSLRGAMETARKRNELKSTGTPGVFKRGEKLEEYAPYFAHRLAEKKADREAAMARAQVSGGNAMSNFLARKDYERQFVPEATWRGPTGLAKGISNVQNLFDVWQSLPEAPDFAKPGLDIIQDTLGGLGLSGLGRWGEERFDLRSEPARSARGQAAVTLDQIRNSIFGSALTSYEIAEGGKSNPLASGISTQQVETRMRKLMQYLAGQARTLMAGRQPPGPAGSWQMPVWMDPNYQWTPPVSGGEQAPQMTPGQVPQIPGAGPGQTVTPQTMPPASDEELQRQYEALQQWKATQGAP